MGRVTKWALRPPVPEREARSRKTPRCRAPPRNTRHHWGQSTRALAALSSLGETHDVGRFPTAAAFGAHAGVAPVPASSGTTTRHRLNRGGNRQLNRALFTVAMVQARWDDQGSACLARKQMMRSRQPRVQQSLLRPKTTGKHSGTNGCTRRCSGSLGRPRMTSALTVWFPSSDRGRTYRQHRLSDLRLGEIPLATSG